MHEIKASAECELEAGDRLGRDEDVVMKSVLMREAFLQPDANERVRCGETRAMIASTFRPAWRLRKGSAGLGRRDRFSRQSLEARSAARVRPAAPRLGNADFCVNPPGANAP